MTTWALIVGSICMAAGGFLLAVLLLVAFSWALGYLGWYVFKRLRRIYHLSVIFYWLTRLEREGTHCFDKPTEVDHNDSLSRDLRGQPHEK